METTSSIQILPETKMRISIENYTELPGTLNENILCALMVNTCASTRPITPDLFLNLYKWLADMVYQGINVDFTVHPLLKDSQLLKDALRLKGDETENLKSRRSCMQIANMISNHNEDFAKELNSVYTNSEAKLLVSAFLRGCAM